MASFSFRPSATAVLYEWDRHRPIISSNVERGGLIGFDHDAMHLVIMAKKVRSHVFVGHIVTGVEDRTCIGAEDRIQGSIVA